MIPHVAHLALPFITFLAPQRCKRDAAKQDLSSQRAAQLQRKDALIRLVTQCGLDRRGAIAILNHERAA